MATVPKPDQRKALDGHRLQMIRLGREVNARAGIPYEPPMTIEELHESMLRSGIRPEDNILSSEILRMRYGDEQEVRGE